MKSIKKILAIVLSTILALGVMSVSAFAEETAGDTTGEAVEKEIVSVVDVVVPAPIDGDVATGTCIIEDSEYELSFIQWVEYSSENILYSSDETVEAEGNFELGKSYVVCITVSAAEGYVFDSADNLIVSINGYEATLADISEDGTELSFTCIFDCGTGIGDGSGDDVSGGFDFDQILGFLKTLLMTFVRFIGSIFGIS